MKSLRQVWAAAQGNPRNPEIAKRFKRSKNQEAKRPLIPLPLLKAAAKRARLPQAEDSAPMRISRIGSPNVPGAKPRKACVKVWNASMLFYRKPKEKFPVKSDFS